MSLGPYRVVRAGELVVVAREEPFTHMCFNCDYRTNLATADATFWSYPADPSGNLRATKTGSTARKPLTYGVSFAATRTVMRPIGRCRRWTPWYLIEGAALTRIIDGLLERRPDMVRDPINPGVWRVAFN